MVPILGTEPSTGGLHSSRPDENRNVWTRSNKKRTVVSQIAETSSINKAMITKADKNSTTVTETDCQNKARVVYNSHLKT